MIAVALRTALLGVTFGLTASLAIAAIAWLTPRDDSDPWAGKEGEE